MPRLSAVGISGLQAGEDVKPLIWEHVNPYGRFDLDMNVRLALL